jgi:hypothetical protein
MHATDPDSAPAPAPATDVFSPPAPAVHARAPARVAEQLRDSAPAMLLFASLRDVFEGLDPLSFQLFRDQLVADAGGPADPIEVMLIEAAALAHLNAGRLVAKSSAAAHVDAARAFGGLAVAMLGELRRTALALAAYRSAAAARPAAVAGGGGPDTELGSNGGVGDGGRDGGGSGRDREEPAAGGGGPGERPEAPGPDRRRARAAPRRRVG